MNVSANRPAGRLVPVFAANEDLDIRPVGSANLTLALARAAAARGETVLILDQMDGQLMRAAGIISGADLSDVLAGRASILDAKYIDREGRFTAMCIGAAPLDEILGTLAALSLNYDWVFIGVKPGCTPAHVRLAAAADCALMLYDTKSDQFMRAYWMLDAIRMRLPHFDPLVLACGPIAEGRETFDLLNATVQDFLGARLTCGGLMDSAQAAAQHAPVLLDQICNMTDLGTRSGPSILPDRISRLKTHKSA